MIIQCSTCHYYFDDANRVCICPHEVFPANDGRNNFIVNYSAYLSTEPPTEAQIDQSKPLTNPSHAALLRAAVDMLSDHPHYRQLTKAEIYTKLEERAGLSCLAKT